jgi:small subunit ribosomal protein S1
MRAGEVITAEVIRIDQNHVVVNAGLKSESFIPLEEFLNDQGEVDVKEGDFISVAIESLEDGRGETRLSRDRAKRLAAWLSLEKALEAAELVTGTVTGKVKGGLTVMTNGIRPWLTASSNVVIHPTRLVVSEGSIWPTARSCASCCSRCPMLTWHFRIVCTRRPCRS